MLLIDVNCLLGLTAHLLNYVHSSRVSYRIVQLICLEPPPPVVARFACLTKMSISVICLSSFLKILRNI